MLIFCMLSCTRPLPDLVSPQASEDSSSTEQAPHASVKPQRITTNPENEFLPSVSQDGRWIAYVSDRSGNLDIWLQDIGARETKVPLRVTFSAATDTEPSISPSGKKMLITSMQNDALGDIFMLYTRRVSGRRAPALRRLTSEGSAEREGVFAVDEKSIFFTQGRGQKRNIVQMNLKNRETLSLGLSPAGQAAPSPDGRFLAFTRFFTHIEGDKRSGGVIGLFDPKNKTAIEVTDGLDSQPVWSNRGEVIYFCRYADDTNLDGKIDIFDQPSLWYIPFSPELFQRKIKPLAYPITPSVVSTLFPALSAEKIFFTRFSSVGSDIWWLYEKNLFPRFSSRKELLSLAQEASDPYEAIHFSRMAAYFEPDRFKDQNSDTHLKAQAELMRASRYFSLGNFRQAEETLRSLIQDYPQEKSIVGLAQILNIRIQYGITDNAIKRQKISQEVGKTAEKDFKEWIAKSDDPVVQATAQLAIGDCLRGMKEDALALKAYQSVVDLYPQARDQAAEARLKRGDIFFIFGDEAQLKETYLSIIRDYAQTPKWCRAAAKRLVELAVRFERLDEQVAKLRELVSFFTDLPILPALAQNKIGDVYAEAAKLVEAKRAYQATIADFPNSIEEVADAYFKLGQILVKEESGNEAFALYRQMIGVKKFPLDIGDRAKTAYIHTALDEAEKEQRLKEWGQAARIYRELIAFDDDIVEAHRGIVSCAAGRGQILEAIQEYQTRVQSEPGNHVVHYALGLAMTYLPELEQRENLKKAREAIENAISEIETSLHINALNPFGHQTLGWLLEQKDRVVEEMELREGKLQRYSRLLLGFVLDWLFEEHPASVLEQSLESYSRALALMDSNARARVAADLYLNMGNGYLRLEEFQRAYHYYEQRLKTGLPFDLPKREYAFYQNLGRAAFRMERYDEAAVYLQKALDYAEANEPVGDQIKLCTRLALNFQDANRYPEAIRYFQKALALNEKLGRLDLEAEALRNVAINEYFQGIENRSGVMFAAALDHFFESSDALNRYGIVQKDSSGGLLNIQTSASESATASSEAAEGFDERGEQALIFTFVGNIYKAFEDYPNAQKFLEKKLDLLEQKIDDRPIARKFLKKRQTLQKATGIGTDDLALLTQRAQILNNLGYLSFQIRDTDKAASYFDASLTLCQQLENRQGILINTANIGKIILEAERVDFQTVNRAISLQEAALKEARPSKEIAEQKSDASASKSPQNTIAPIYEIALENNLGGLKYLMSERFIFDLDLSHDKESKKRQEKDEFSAVQNGLKDLEEQYLKIEKRRHELLDQAESHFQNAFSIAEKNEIAGDTKVALLSNLAIITEQEANLTLKSEREIALKKARAYLEEAKAIADAHHFAQIRWKIEAHLARFLPPEEARSAFTRAVTALETYPPMIVLPRASKQDWVQVRKLYEELVQSLWDTTPVDAFWATELYFSRRLVMSLRAYDLPFSDPQVQSLFRSGKGIEKDIEQALNRLHEKKGITPDVSLQQAVTTGLQTYKTYLDSLTEKAPELAPLLSGLAVSPGEIQAILPDKMALLKLFTLGNKTLAWFVTHDETFSYEIALSPTQIYEIQKSGETEKIVQGVFMPISEKLSAIQSLYIAPDQYLWRVPFEALNYQGKPLGEQYSVSYLPSATLLAMADRVKNLNKSRMLYAAVSDALETPLSPEYLEALQHVTAISEKMTEPQTPKTRWIELAKDSGIIQIEMPLRFHPIFPEKSSIRFSDNGRGTSDFETWEIPSMRLGSHLTILPNARFPEDSTAIQEDLLVFSSLMILSGTPTLLFSRTPLSEAKRSAFWTHFYPALRTNAVSEALRMAAKEGGEHPFFVVGFQGMSEAESLEFARQHYRTDATLANKAFQEKAWDKAIEAFERTLIDVEYLRKDAQFAEKVLPKILPVLYFRLIQSAVQNRDIPRAILHEERYIEIIKSENKIEEVAKEQKSLGLLYSRIGNQKKALENLEAALTYFESKGILEETIDVFSRMGEIYENAGNYPEALKKLEQAYDLSKKGGLTRLAAGQASDMGRLYNLRLTAYASAESFYRIALSHYEELDDRLAISGLRLKIALTRQRTGDFQGALDEINEARRFAGTDSRLLAMSDLYEAGIAWYQGRYGQAQTLKDNVLKQAKDLNMVDLEIQALNLQGLIEQNIGHPDLALDAHNSALSLAEGEGDNVEMAATLNNIGVTLREQGKLAESLKAFQSALKIDEELKDRSGQAYDLRNIGVTFQRFNRPDESLEALQKSLKLSSAVGDSYNMANTLYNIGAVEQIRGRLDQAKSAFEEALSLATKSYLPEFKWRILQALGNLERSTGLLDPAYQRFKQAIEIVEKLRAQVQGEKARSGFIENKIDLYEDMVTMLLTLNRPEEAFDYAERSRSRNFIDILGHQNLTLKNEDATKLLDETHKLKSQIEALSASIARATEEEAKRLSKTLEELTKKYESLLATVQTQDQELASFVSVDPITLQKLYEILPTDLTLIEYMITREKLIIWVIQNKTLNVVEVPVQETELIRLVFDLLQNIQSIGPVQEKSEKLYSYLIEPILGQIGQSKTICLIPHRILHNLSFAALSKGGRYLIQDVALFSVPSASVLSYLLKKPPVKTVNHILALGNPDLKDASFDLPFAEKEAISIRRSFPGADIFIRDQATESLLHKSLSKYQVIHLASHGFFNPDNPLESMLKFAPDETNDGVITAREIFQLDLSANLVTLSACQTGISKVTKGDEIIGFSRAFLYAGTPSIIVSLWGVNDVATAILVKHLYRYYPGLNKAESLRQAQLKVMEYYPHPTYWAGFILVGVP